MVKKATSKREDDGAVLNILPLSTGHITFRILGITPLLLNRMSEKTKRELLYPSPKKNEAERLATFKHEPFEEYRASPYRNRDDSEPTLFHLPSGMFKKAMGTAALDIPGAFKAQVGRLCSVTSYQINLYGKPFLKTDVVRQSGINRAPDIRIRACLPEWACEITVRHAATRISPRSVVNLMAAAGLYCGVGDNRVEKGANDFGQFELVDEDNKDWARIVKTQTRKVQEAALAHPEYFDIESEDLVSWFYAERDRRRNLPGDERKPAKKAAAAEPDVEMFEVPPPRRGRPRKNGEARQ